MSQRTARGTWRAAAIAALAFLVLAGGVADVGPTAPLSPVSLTEYLNGLAIDLLRQSPQTITARGAARELGLRNDGLDSLVLDSSGASYAPLARAVKRVRAADLSRASSSERAAFLSFAAWLESALGGRAFQDNVCLVSTYMTSVPQHLAWFMTRIHPLAAPDDAEDYLTRLAQIPARFDELATRLAASEAKRALAPGFLLSRAADEIEAIGRNASEEDGLLGHFLAGLDRIPTLDAAAREDLARRAQTLIDERVAPAYLALAVHVRTLAARTPDDVGVWRLEDGAAYYAYLLRAYTTTGMTADEIYELGLREVARVQEEIRALAARHGYDPTLSMPALFARVRSDCGLVAGAAAVEACRSLVAKTTDLARPAFGRWPRATLSVEPGENIAYFAEGARDGSRSGVFYVPVDQVRLACSLGSLVAHETVPGHFLQSAIAQESGLPHFLADVSFSAYVEGWATYAERLAAELGAYRDDPHGDLGRLQEELFRAARLVVDPGLHARHWTYEQAVAYMTEATGLAETTVRDEVDRYVVAPGQAVSYGVGLAAFLELRERARAALGPAFDLAEFHEAVLSCGPVPLPVLDSVVGEYIAARRQAPT